MAQTEVSPQRSGIDPLGSGVRRLFRGVSSKRLPWWIWAPVIGMVLVPLAENWLHPFGIELLHRQTTALVRAIDRGDMAQVRALIDHGVNLNAQVPNPFSEARGENPVTPLLWAHQMNRPEAVDLLHARHAQIAPASDHDALGKAIRWNETEEMRRLIRAGADLHPYNKGSLTLLHYAAWAHNPEAVKILVEAGLDVNAPTIYGNSGRTPLSFAAEPYSPNPDDPEARAQVVAFLLAHGADPGLKDREAKTPLDIARQNHYKAVEDVLLNFKQPPKDSHP